MSDENANTADSALPARPALAAAPAADPIDDGHARRLMDALADNRPLTDAERSMLLGLVMQRDQADAGLLQIITDLRARLAAAASAVGAAPADALPADDADVLRKLAQRAALEAAVNRACDGSTLAQKSACLEWLASEAEYQRMLTGGRRGGDLMAAEKALATQMAYLVRPQPPAPADDLLAQLDDLRVQLDEAQQAPWPAWATEILKTVREFSGYDGFDDSAEGVDLPEEVRECLQELGSQVERLRAQCRAPAPVAGTGPAKQWLWRMRPAKSS